MRVTQSIDVTVDVEVDVSIADFLAELRALPRAESFEGLASVVSIAHNLIKSVPDDLVAALTEPQRLTMRDALQIQADRYGATLERFDLIKHLARQRAFSLETFGPGARTAGVLDHIRRELLEVEASPADLSEWIDVVILALDGALRAGHAPASIVGALVAKQTKNEARTWPDWRKADPDKAIEHYRDPYRPGGWSTERPAEDHCK